MIQILSVGSSEIVHLNKFVSAPTDNGKSLETSIDEIIKIKFRIQKKLDMYNLFRNRLTKIL